MAASLQTLNAAFETCRSAREGDDEDHLERLEKIVLRHRPLGPENAGIVLATALENLRHGGRSDGLDVKAVEHVIRWLGVQKQAMDSGQGRRQA